MCGLTGLLDVSANGFAGKDVDLFEGLLLINSLRGRSSTGVFGVNKHKQADIHKVLGNPYNLDVTVLGDWFNNRMLNRYWAVAGHGRFPTQGEISIQNAHPFQHGNITLMHNGTLRNLPRLLKEHNKDFAVDSEMICWMVNELGIKDTIKEIEGAYALIWYDAGDDTYNFLRNQDRPLYYGVNSFNDQMVLGSEEHYIEWANSKTYKRFKEVKAVALDSHYKIGREKNKFVIQREDVRKSYSYQGHHNMSYYGRHGGYDDIWGASEESPLALPASFKKKTEPPKTNTAKPTIICLAEDLHFEVLSVAAVKIKETDKTETLVTGHHVDTKKVAVAVASSTAPDDLKKKVTEDPHYVMKGRVAAILPKVISEGNMFTLSVRVVLNTLEEVPKDSKVVQSTNIVPFNNNMVKLRDGTAMSKVEFVRIAKPGCFHCQGPVKLESAEECSRMVLNGISSLICGDCHRVETKKEPENANQQQATVH